MSEKTDVIEISTEEVMQIILKKYKNETINIINNAFNKNILNEKKDIFIYASTNMYGIENTINTIKECLEDGTAIDQTGRKGIMLLNFSRGNSLSSAGFEKWLNKSDYEIVINTKETLVILVSMDLDIYSNIGYYYLGSTKKRKKYNLGAEMESNSISEVSNTMIALIDVNENVQMLKYLDSDVEESYTAYRNYHPNEKCRVPKDISLYAYENNVEKIIECLKSGVDINFQQKRSRSTALMMAISNGSPALVKWLLNLGADPFIKDSTGANSFDYINYGNMNFEHAYLIKDILNKKHDIK